MIYLDPALSFFKGWPSARGAGTHADQADSVIEAVNRGRLPAPVRKEIPAGNVVEPLVRTNPPKAGSEDGGSITHDWLKPIAGLVTGTWGPTKISFNRQLSGEQYPRTNPPQPVKVLDSRDFLLRMYDLREKLVELKAQAPTRKGASWGVNIDRMIKAVEFVIAAADSPKPSILADAFEGDKKGLPFGMRWGVVAVKSNQKLPFFAYSELPMATCAGAGACRNWCYSFKSWRYPSAFVRQFLNTLANYADREFALWAAAGRRISSNSLTPGERIQYTLKGARLWPQYVKGMLLDMSKKQREAKTVFLRLFVDGDINTEDSVLEWMEVCKDVGIGGRDITAGRKHIEVYGYSKSWAAFVNVDKQLKYDWPKNYTVNMSTGSLYAQGDPNVGNAVRSAMEQLPIVRGYFEAIDITTYLDKLNEVYKQPLKIPDATHFPFSEKRIKAFVALYQVQTWDQAKSLLGKDFSCPKTAPVEVIRKKMFHAYWKKLLGSDAQFRNLVRKEIAKDRGFKSEKEYLAAFGKEAEATTEDAIIGEDAEMPATAYTDKMLNDKSLALALHEVLWSYGIGGSCPLLCGNCSDEINPSPKNPGVHRCASKNLFKGKTIHIGLH